MVRGLGRAAAGLPFAVLVPAAGQLSGGEIIRHLSTGRPAELGPRVKKKGFRGENAETSTRKNEDRQAQAAKRSNPEQTFSPPEQRGNLLDAWTGQPDSILSNEIYVPDYSLEFFL